VATYSYTTTARNDSGLAAFLAYVNAQRAANGQGAITLTQAFNALVSKSMNDWADQADEDERQTVRQAWINATTAQRTAAKTALGL
jgi:hypothetical protein